MATIKFTVAYPLSNRSRRKRMQKEQIIEQGETLANVLIRLCSNDHETWQVIWDKQANRLHNDVLITVNNHSLLPEDVFEVQLSDGDAVTVHKVVSGG